MRSKAGSATRALRVLLRILITGVYLTLCALFIQLSSPGLRVADLNDIRQKGRLTVITRNNAHCYYHYRDQPMGFEYDLAKAFARELGVRLDVHIADRWEVFIPHLLDGEGQAIVAASLTDTPQRRRRVAFSEGYLTIRQHLIMHRRNKAIRKVADLAGHTVHVRRGTSYQERIEDLQRQGLAVELQLHPDVPTEELIRRVAAREIELTVADSHIAKLNRRYYPEVRVGPAIHREERLAWAVHPHAPRMRGRINRFFRRIKADGTFDKLYARYFAEIERFDYLDVRAFHRRLRRRLPRYEKIIRAAAEQHGFDWRLIAAQIYQESHLKPKARSHAGAHGLMQLTWDTARSLGVKNILDPKENINAGVRHLKRLYDHFDRAQGVDRLHIALAAYNIGQGHIFDARNLARRKQLDPNRWSSLAETLPLLRFRKYYQDSKYGYCRGTEPIHYIRQIMVYYDILKRRDIEYRVAEPRGQSSRFKVQG